MAEPAYKLPEEDRPDIKPDLPQLRALEGGGETTPRKIGHLQSATDGNRSNSLFNEDESSSSSEESGSKNSGSSNESSSESKKSSENRFNIRKLYSTKKRKRALIGGGLTAGLVGGAFAIFGFLSGPLQFVQAAQMFQKFHFQSNEDFGNDRTSKVLIYALAGLGAERGRLGITGNRAADKWEKQLLERSGMRPVYSSDTRRFVGFEIVDDNKAFDSLSDSSNGRDRKAIERAMGNGAEIRTASEASSNRQRIVRGGKDSKALPGNTRIIDLRDVSFKDRRAMIRTMGRVGDTSKISSALGSRLLIKRAGVDFHPLKNIKRKTGDSVADYRQKRQEEKALRDKEGVDAAGLGHDTSKDSEGNPNESADQAKAADDANTAIDEAKKQTGRENVEKIVQKIGKGGAAVGILCAAKSLGDDIPKYKYENNALPMIRMGMSVITMGNQVMSAKDVNMEEIAAMSEAFHDEKNDTTWNSAESIMAESGKTGGVDMPVEAQLNNINDKPKFFDALDKLPFLGTGCGALGAVGGLPIIGDVLDLTSKVAVDAMNGVVGIFGTSVEDIMTSALAAVSGNSVDTLASGANFGNFANTGAFLAANDSAVSMGGAAMSGSSVAEIKNLERIAAAEETAAKPIAQRYLDPYATNSLAATFTQSMPSSLGSLVEGLKGLPSNILGSFNNFGRLVIPQAYAATGGYDYGVPKYGFTLEERNNGDFEDPYLNAEVIERDGVLDDLNEKYGMKCFGMTVTADESGVHVTSESMGNENLNIFRIRKEHPECDPKNNNDPMFLRYRFYLADAVTANSLNCFHNGQGAEQSCADLGMGAPSGGGGEDSISPVSGNAQEIAKQILGNKNIDLSCYRASVLADVKATAEGKDGTAGAPMSATILQLVATVGQKHKVCITAFQSEGGGHSAGSYHYDGAAVDFGSLDGVMVTGRDPGSLKIIEIAKDILPSETGLGQVTCGSTPSLPSGWYTFNDACNHLHMQIPRGSK